MVSTHNAESNRKQKQAQIFTSLMQNWGDVTKYVAAETNSAGLAQDRYAIYLDNVEAAQNRVTASWERLAQTAVSSGAVAGVYDMLAGILDVMSQMGGIPTILGVIITSLIAFNGASLLATAGITSLSSALEVLAFSMATNPFGWIVLAVGAAVLAINYFNETTEETQIRLQKLQAEVDRTTSSLARLSGQKSQISDLWGELETLRNKSSLTNQEQSSFYEIQTQLRDILPQVSGYYDEQGQFIIDESVNLQELLKLKQEEIDIEREKLAIQSQKNIEEEIEAYKKVRKAILDLQSAQKANAGALDTKNIFTGKTLGEVLSEDLKENSLAQREYINQIKTNFYSLAAEQQKLMLEMLQNGDVIDQEIARQLKMVGDSVASTTDALSDSSLSSGSGFDGFTSGAADAMSALQEKVVQMIKDMKNAEKDALQQELSDYKYMIEQEKDLLKEKYDAEKQALDDRKKLLDRQYEDEKRNRDNRKDAIRDEISNYDDIISKQEDLLDAKKREDDYNRKKEDRQDDLADLEARILELSLDNSAEGIAKRKELEEKAAELRKDIASDEADHEYDLQKDALEKEKEKFREEAELRIKQLEEEQEASDLRHEMRLRELEDAQDALSQQYQAQVSALDEQYKLKEKDLQDKIRLIDDYLKQEGTINQDALKMIQENNASLYESLLEWNKKYGTGIDQDIISIWEQAIAKVEDYASAVNDIPSGGTPVTGEVGGRWRQGDDWKYHHDGINAGPVGGVSLKANEDFIKVLKGEVVVNEPQMEGFINSTFPKMLSSPQVSSINSGGNTEINMPITFSGVTKDIIPQIEDILDKAVDKLNRSMQRRGITRRVESFGL